MDQLVTREGDLFQVSSRQGDFVPEEGPFGLFARDTRYLSRFELRLNGAKPQLLASTAAENYVQRVFLQAGVQDHMFYQSKVGMQRHRVIHQGVMYERIRVTNAEPRPVALQLELRFDADFVDLFEVRGTSRTARGERWVPRLEGAAVTLGYRGLDLIERHTALRFAPVPARLTSEQANWDLTLAPKESFTVDVAVSPAENGAFPHATDFDRALQSLRDDYAAWQRSHATFDSDSPILNRVLERSALDLRVLTADHGHGTFPVAGIPWFAVPFGRDSLITAIQALAFNPDLARGTLQTMAALQGQEVNTFRVEEPGKIPHEFRYGEMANLGEVPFGRYYGSVDSTPLFLILLCEYYAWTGDLGFVHSLLPNILQALQWLDTYGDSDGDGFLEYRADKGLGLTVQSWKDSHDSMSHRDGRPAASPVAVSEVQGYAYAAKHRLAPIMQALGEAELGARLAREADELKARFNQAFWMEDRGFLAIALDGEKAQVGTVSSDIGHALWSGIVEEQKAAAVARRLVAPDMFSGWGIRTLSAEELTYNEMSYHNGSVWPHDNSLCVLGLKRYGFDQEANRVITGLIDAASHFEYFRLPELFCGFSREVGMPVDYPVACSPQAWAAATPFALVQAMLGLEPDAAAGVLKVRPCLPPWLNRLSVRGLQVGQARVDLEVTNQGVQATVSGERNLRVDVVNRG